MAREIEKRLKFEEHLRELTFRLISCESVGRLLLEIRLELVELFGVEAFSIFLFDKVSNQLASRYHSQTDMEAIHIPVDKNSIAGYVALAKEVVQISDVYDANELKMISAEISFDKRWDKKNHFRTKSLLVVPMDFQGELLGVLELINKRGDEGFSTFDRSAVQKFGRTLGLAFANAQRVKDGKARVAKFDYLVMNNIISQDELDRAIQLERSTGQSIESILERNFRIQKTNIQKALCFFHKKSFFPYKPEIKIARELLEQTKLKAGYLRKNVWVPVMMGTGDIFVLMDDPNDVVRLDSIKQILPGAKFTLFISSREDIFKYIDQLGDMAGKDDAERSPGDDDAGAAVSGHGHGREFGDGDGEFSESDHAIVRLANQIIDDAVMKGISDIHIEPDPNRETTIRFRKDGSCYQAMRVPLDQASALISRLKLMARIDISQKRLPQDGKIKTMAGGKEVELRVATIPTVNDQEDMVLRILAGSEPIPLDRLNLLPINLKRFKDALEKPYGLVLVVGPTGSGKTTTLHAALGHLNRPEKKIWTAEDPVEITQFGLRQVQMNLKAGLTFASAMRAFLRANPDVIMVGEMRDAETASIAIEASLTGHLVLSTLHTNSAPETVSRLTDMGIEPFHFSDALIAILAQRLVKTLCPSCKTPYPAAPEEFSQLANEFGPELWKARVKLPHVDQAKLYKGSGCERCNFTGFRGRTGIYELLLNSDEVKRLIQTRAKVPEIRRKAIEEGMFTLKQDGILKVVKGDTTLAQVLGVAMK
jgi:type II secretory ATPase GspE/PulE/Tfp pilus assembly ATPase PilB-like protein